MLTFTEMNYYKSLEPFEMSASGFAHLSKAAQDRGARSKITLFLLTYG